VGKGNKQKAKGTREERRQKTLLESHGFDVIRLVEGGIYDEGDLRLTTGNWELTIESKDSAALNIHETVMKANRKAVVGPAVVWWKRTKQQPGKKIRTQVGKPIVCMSEELFIEFLGYARSVWTDPNK
jgi:hypothetical protein